MSLAEKITVIVKESVDELNEIIPSGNRISSEPDTVLFGKGATMDSLGLVQLISIIEQKVSDELNLEISLATEKAMSQKNSPFRTIQSITEFTLLVVEESK